MKNFPTSLAAEATFLRDGLAVLDPVKSQAEAIDDIRALEELKAACAAAQARRTAELEALRHEEEKARGVAKARRGNGLAAEIGLARGQSPARGTK
ncbi:MAG: HNH endonuclease, partial [Yaniella sp.]